MKPSSSRVSSVLVCLLMCCACAPVILQAWQARPRTVFSNQALLGGPDGPPVVYKGDQLSRDPNNEVELRLNVQRLYALATELKDEVDHSKVEGTLSATILRRTKDIEKLAKQIRERAKH